MSITMAGVLSSVPVVTATARPVPQKTSTTQTLAPGLTLTRIADPEGPWILRVLTVDPSMPVTIDIATAGGAMGTYARPSSIGSAHGALAAINGDFTVDPGRPLHPFAEDGSLKELGLQGGASFAISQDETQSFIDTEEVTVGGRNLTTKDHFPVAEWNTGPPVGGEVVAFTPYGGSAERPPADACSARLIPAGKMRFGKGGVGLVRDYSVSRRRCAPVAMGMRDGSVVLSADTTGKGATAIKDMKRRRIVRLTWSFGWPGVMDSIGGMPQIVRDGKNIAHTCSSYFCSKNPRTAIGVKANGTILLVTVDGRKGSSVGMTLIQLGKYMRTLGSVSAVNLDGGGGSTMWVDGQGVVNDPSDRSGERAVTNAVLVLPGSDGAEPSIALGASTFAALDPQMLFAPPLSRVQARATIASALADAGSTGGLLEARADGDL
ncbi:MAG TPA: phosphodiester glycosidase family protein [Actinomycetota bacterium]